MYILIVMCAPLYTKHSGVPLPALCLHRTRYSIFIMRLIDRIWGDFISPFISIFRYWYAIPMCIRNKEENMKNRHRFFEKKRRRRTRRGGGVGEKKCNTITRFCASTHFVCVFLLLLVMPLMLVGIHWNYCTSKTKGNNETQAPRLTNHKMVAFSCLPNSKP